MSPNKSDLDEDCETGGVLLEVDGNDTIEGSLDADDDGKEAGTKEDEHGLELLGGTTSGRSMGGVGGGVGASESGMSSSS